MRFSSIVAVAASFLTFGSVSANKDKSYCPSQGGISHAQRVQLFKQFTDELFSATNNGSEVAAAFAKYVSPSLIEHTASSNSFGSDVGFLSALFPTVNVAIIAGIEGCFKSTVGGHICTVHYKATPKSAQSFITNTTVISDYYRYDGTCIVEHWDSTMTANAQTTNPNFPG
jgi:predicted SnoaL-like aldol condensation-catalyzing enzyme